MLPFLSYKNSLSKIGMGNFPNDPVVKTLPSHLNPGQEDKIPYAS